MKKGLRTTWTLVMNSGSAIHRCMSLNISLSSSIFFHKMQINIPILINVVVVQVLSCVQLFATPWTTARQASLSFTISWSCLKIISFESVMPSNHFILYHLLVLMPSVFPSIRVFSNESLLCIRWPKYRSFSICPPHEYLGLISLGLAGLIFLLSKGLSRVSLLSKGLSRASNITV